MSLALPSQILKPWAIHNGFNAPIIVIGSDLKTGRSMKIYTLSPQRQWIEWKLNDLPDIGIVISSAVDIANKIVYIIYCPRLSSNVGRTFII